MKTETILVHKACRSQVITKSGSPVFCEVCNRAVPPEEVEEKDATPSPFSG